MTPFQLHVSKWTNCQECELHETRQNVVLFKGSIPCDVFFLGEAPGPSEDICAKPFVGPAGELLDQIVKQAMIGIPSLRVGFSNLVCCIPLDENLKKFSDQLRDEHIEACKPRLLEIIRIAKPRLLVCLGQPAADWTEQGFRYSIDLPSLRKGDMGRVCLKHPAAIVRSPSAIQQLDVQRAIVTLHNALKGITA